jgi:Asp-tRNA(Asn)/Glu-tRNA(Gln) amidotransferase A subunit family amidase
MACVHAQWFAAFGCRYRPRTAAIIAQGQPVSATTLAAARGGRDELDRALRTALAAAGGDAWVSPAACGPAPAGLEGTGDPVMNLPWSHAGWPVVTVPGGVVHGLPVGLQLAAPPGADEALLGWAEGIEFWLGQLSGAGPQERST